MAASSFFSTGKVRVASLSLCRDDACYLRDGKTFLDSFHLVVDTQEIELHDEAAVAISYTWGEFNRKMVTIGHRVDGETVGLELGEEWVPGDFVSTLANLCTENKAIWIDQLCLPQKQEQLREALVQIPLVYRTLDVRVLMPGSLCKCLKSHVDAHGLETIMVDEATCSDPVRYELWNEVVGTFKGFLTSMGNCINSLGVSAYFDRIWTRQELHYAQRVRLIWTSDKLRQCLPLDNLRLAMICLPEVDVQSAPYLTIVIRGLHQDGVPLDAIRGRISSIISNWADTGSLAFNEILVDQTNPGQMLEAGTFSFIRFLLGFPIRPLRPSTSESQLLASVHLKFADIRDFIGHLGYLQVSHRKASDPRDYVLAVWTECAGYKVPAKYKDMDLASLLEDAVIQMETNHGVSLPVCAPSGLFDDQRTNGGGLFRPTASFNGTDITDVSDVYRYLLPTTVNLPKPVNGCQNIGFARNEIPPLNRPSLSSTAFDLEDLFRAASDRRLNILTILAIAESWPQIFRCSIPDSMSRLLITERHRDSSSDSVKFRWALAVAVEKQAGEKDLEYDSEDLYRDTIDLHAEMYRIVTTVLGLDEKLCREKGLRLMVTQEQRQWPIVGISRKRYPAPTTQVVNTRMPSVISIWASGHQEDVWSCLEAEHSGTDSQTDKLLYRVTGAWVCSRAIPAERITATLGPNGTNSLLI